MLAGKHIIIISVLLSNIQSWPKITIRCLNITHDVLLTQYGGVNTSMSTTGALSIYFHLAREVELFLKLVIDFNSNNVDVNFMNKTVSWCNILQVPRYEPLIKILYKVFSQNAHLPQKCPIKKNHLYYVQNLFFETDKIPPVLPEAIITFNVGIWDRVKGDLLKIANVRMIGQIKHF